MCGEKTRQALHKEVNSQLRCEAEERKLSQPTSNLIPRPLSLGADHRSGGADQEKQHHAAHSHEVHVYLVE